MGHHPPVRPHNPDPQLPHTCSRHAPNPSWMTLTTMPDDGLQPEYDVQRPPAAAPERPTSRRWKGV
ncbi:Hypothetical protein CAP_1861 [Chondromyces apiculatus DSM 436]|uniref:Uncharacterized protein n=1 Tax=Chondromyces apiculatus DSM 436 TaxID=1192034 RepID=A0A017SSP3_9BACT|nr:Hypothetical protein CAP_1861 [Chondromyces apiculatus DSM 436]